jgi:hypothetical protein
MSHPIDKDPRHSMCVVASARAVYGGDVPYRSWHGTTVPVVSPSQSGTDVWLPCAWQGVMSFGPTGVLAHVTGLCSFASQSCSARVVPFVRLAELLSGNWLSFPPRRFALAGVGRPRWVARRELLVDLPASQGCSVRVSLPAGLAGLLSGRWSACPRRRVLGKAYENL